MSAPAIPTGTTEAVDRPGLVELYRRHLSEGRAALGEFLGGRAEVASEGSLVWDADGRPLLDAGGYGVFLLGHRHPAVVEAVRSQLDRHPMSTRVLLEPTQATAATALASVTPDGLDAVHFVNSGAEATEAALKLARANGVTRIIATSGGYHGKTMGALALTGKDLYQRPFAPMLDGVVHVAYDDVDAVEAALADTPGRACVFVEPVQGEGGVIVPAHDYLQRLQAACRQHGALLVIDEIQTGLGRLGAWWGSDLAGISPDMLLVGKGLSGGVVPVAALVATREVYKPFSQDPFIHSSTFAGSPLAMAAAAAAVDTTAREGIVERTRDLGDTVARDVAATVGEHCAHLVTEVRHVGLLIGVELADEGVAGALVLELLDQGVIVNHSLNDNRVVRMTPPATLTDDELEWLSSAWQAAARAVGATFPPGS